MPNRYSRIGVRFRAGLITLVVACITFAVTFVIWPPLVPRWGPTSAQALGYGLLAAECVAIGGGVAFLAFGYPTVKRLSVSPRLAFGSYLGIGYFLVNWWPHDHLHAIALSLDFSSLIWMSIAIEYAFHVGMMVFGGILALFFAEILIATSATEPANETAAAPARSTATAHEVMVR
jgi:hypothetical protein